VNEIHTLTVIYIEISKIIIMFKSFLTTFAEITIFLEQMRLYRKFVSLMNTFVKNVNYFLRQYQKLARAQNQTSLTS